MRKLLNLIAVIIALVIAIVLVASAYAGTVSPEKSTVPALLAMIFPIVAPVAVIAAICLAFLKRAASLILVVALLISLPTLLTYFPLNFSTNIGKPSFSVLTYNVANLTDFASGGRTPKENPTLRFILDQSPDIAALQECATFASSHETAVSPSLLDSLFKAYPHHTNGAEGQALLSRFPFEEIKLHHPPRHNFQVRAYRIYAPADTFTLFNLHLKSIGLSEEDKTLYKDLTKGKTEGDGIKQELKEIRSSLISKLSAAFKVRARHALLVKEMIDSIGGKVIVCGDFNDVPGCYAIRAIESAGLKDAYRESALGFAITFHEDRFYFRIDHILYRGFTPLRTRRIKVPYSDHYPLFATFSPQK